MFYDSLYASICSATTLQSNREGFFKQFADSVTNKAGDDFIRSFEKLSTNKERILRCYKAKTIYDEVHGPLENVQEIYRAKSVFMSTQKRQEADYLLKTGKNQRALLLYNQSVVRAPATGIEKSHDNGLSLTLAMWGRSQCLLLLKEYQLCLTDVQQCLKEKLPQNLKLDAYWTMSECYSNLGYVDKANISLKVLDKMIQQKEYALITDSWRNKIKEKVENINSEKSIDKTARGTNTDNAPSPTAGEHSVLKGASKALQLKRDEQVGNYIAASMPIKTGDTILVEDPYAACLVPEKFGSHCHHCFSIVKSAIPCYKCSGVAFCSVSCRDKAQSTYHKYECTYMDLLIGSGMSILCFVALRIVTQNTLDYFVDAKNKQQSRKFNRSSHPYYRVYNLESHADKRSGLEFLHRTLMALFLLSVLKKSGYFQNQDVITDVLSPSELTVCDVLLRNLEVLQFNAHEIYETVITNDSSSETKRSKTVYIGAAIYKTASYFNHDCYPAIIRYFVGNKLVMKALRPISVDEQVPENYGVAFVTHTLKDRQRTLLSRYWFHCKCAACVQNWPLLDKLENFHARMKCANKECKNTLTVIESGNMTCFSCNSEICVKKIEEQVEELKKMFERGIEEIKTQNYSEAIALLSRFSDDVNLLCYPPNKELCLSHDALRSCWSKDGNIIWKM